VKISAKLLGSVLVIFVMAFAGLAYLVDRSARSALVSQATRQLDVVRQSRAQALTTYFKRAYDGLEGAAGGVTTDVLLREMPEALRRLPHELASDGSDRRAHLIDFYKTEVDSRMNRAGIWWPCAEHRRRQTGTSDPRRQSSHHLRPAERAV
jgi:hypothetical protein